MNADVLFSYLLGMDGVLLTSCAVVIAIVAVVELGRSCGTQMIAMPAPLAPTAGGTAMVLPRSSTATADRARRSGSTEGPAKPQEN